ncbi:MAG: cupin domain-containing protein [Campylobacterales bacterium]|nr:cupin domain-containing protein [Campylobacterales bacterium]
MLKNIFESIPKDLSHEVFEEIVSSEDIKIERIISHGHTSPQDGWYDQKQNEWVMVLDGEAILSFEDKDDVKLKKGDFINIKAHQKHKVSYTKPDGYTIWLCIFY